MTAAVILFPGSNRDRDMLAALEKIGGKPPLTVWHTDTSVPDADLYVVPGGFSYGDYLRSGAIAARSPVMDALRARAEQGRLILGVCNGFQILTEAGLLPGVLMRNAGKVVTTEFLIRRIWPMDEAYEDRLHVHVHRLRRKVEQEPSKPQYVVSERGVGYRFPARQPV